MKCPHCSYSHGHYDMKSDSISEGKEGDFYKLPVDLTRDDYFFKKTISLYACPECKKTFIE